MDRFSSPEHRRIDSAANAWRDISHEAVAALHVRWRILVEHGSTLVVRRELLDGDGRMVGAIVDFSLECEDENAAVIRLEAANAIGRSEASVGKALLLLGSDWFGSRVEAGALAIQAAREDADRTAIRLAEAEARLTKIIGVHFKGGKKDARLELRRGDSTDAAWSISFAEAWERDRFWDWLKWQRARFPEFLELLEASDAPTLRSRLLREMLETEQAARRNKLTTGGRRPLRFWCGETA